MRIGTKALALLLAASLGARAEGAKASASHSSGGGHSGGSDTGLVLVDLFLNLLVLGVEVAAMETAVANAPPPPEGYEHMPAGSYQQRMSSDDDPRYWSRPRRRAQSREGLLISFGIGGGSMFVSNQSPNRTGAFDLDFRLGYGFGDRFQLFMDVDLAAASYRNALYGSDEVANWTFTLRGQTVLIGDRAGNGLNLNLGIGLGGVTRNSGYADQVSWPSGLALAGGLSYDARVTPYFSLSPELFYNWHQIPNDPRGHDVASVYGLRLNFLWYLH
jgi:hypothetical protein